MEYIYSAMLLHSAGKKITAENVKKVLTAAGVKADDARIKALVASLDGVDIEEAIKSAAAAPVAVAAASAPAADTSKKKRKRIRRKRKRKNKYPKKKQLQDLEHSSINQMIPKCGSPTGQPHKPLFYDFFLIEKRIQPFFC